MNVLLIGQERSFFSGSGSAGDLCTRHIRYAQALRARCGDQSSIRIVVSAPPGHDRQPRQVAEGLTFFPIPHGRRLMYQPAAHRTLRSVLADWRPDLVSTQTPFQDGLVGLRMARRLGVPSLAQVHFDIFSQQWRQENLLTRVRYPLGRYVLRHADRVRAVSSPLKRNLVDRWDIPAHHVHVVPVGVTLPEPSEPLERTAAQQEICPDFVGHPVVLFAGRLAPEKNLRLWLAVARRVLDVQPEARFLIVGDGPERPAVERLIESHRLTQAVHMTGALPYERMGIAFAASNVLLLTSFYEGYGRVIVEAYLTDRPVVATRCCGPEDLVVDGHTGYHCPIGDEAGLSEAVVQLLTRETLAQDMAQRGKRMMHQRFSVDILIDQLIDCWQLTASRASDCIDVTLTNSGKGEAFG